MQTHENQTRYQGIIIGQYSWAEPGPVFETEEAAQKWVDEKIAFTRRWRNGRTDDMGYVRKLKAGESA